MKYDLDISVDEKLSRLGESTFDLRRSERDYAERGEDAFAPSHSLDYEDWKRVNKQARKE